jgi:hypothetical protein
MNYTQLFGEIESLSQNISNLTVEIKNIANQLKDIKSEPTEKEIIEMYNKSELNCCLINNLHDHHRRLDNIITNLRDYYCNHNRIIDRENFDKDRTCYCCSKCGMIM